MDLKHYFTSPLEAVQVTDDNMEEIAAWCGGRVVHDDDRPYVWVPVPEGSRSATAFKGTWITRRCVISLKNEIKYTFSVFRPDYFKKNYFDTPAGAVDATWEKADRQKSRKKSPKRRAAEAVMRDETVNQIDQRLKERVAEMEVTMNAMAVRLGLAKDAGGNFVSAVPNPGAHVEVFVSGDASPIEVAKAVTDHMAEYKAVGEPMSDAIIVKPTDAFAHEVLQNAENQSDAGKLVAQHLGLRAEDVIVDEAIELTRNVDPKTQMIEQNIKEARDLSTDGDALPSHLTESQLEGMDEADVERVLNEEIVLIHHHTWKDVCSEHGCKIEDYDGGPHKQVFNDKSFAISAFGASVEIEDQYDEYKDL